MYNYNQSQMTSVDILFCTGTYLISPCAIETTIVYYWLGLYSSMNLAAEESDE